MHGCEGELQQDGRKLYENSHVFVLGLQRSLVDGLQFRESEGFRGVCTIFPTE